MVQNQISLIMTGTRDHFNVDLFIRVPMQALPFIPLVFAALRFSWFSLRVEKDGRSASWKLSQVLGFGVAPGPPTHTCERAGYGTGVSALDVRLGTRVHASVCYRAVRRQRSAPCSMPTAEMNVDSGQGRRVGSAPKSRPLWPRLARISCSLPRTAFGPSRSPAMLAVRRGQLLANLPFRLGAGLGPGTVDTDGRQGPRPTVFTGAFFPTQLC